MRVTIGSRRSDLARIQAYQVGEALRAAHTQIEINYSFHESLGDKNLDDPLWKMPEKGVFTQDFREGLLRGDFDLVVHSWKDLAIEVDPETEIIATLPRADARDLLLVREDRWAKVAASGVMTIFTSSPRRAHNLDSFLRQALPAKLTELNFTNVRGNVPTRVRKLLQTDVDGLIVAKAALDRLLSAPAEGADDFVETKSELRAALSQCRFMVMPLRENPSAPAQGALAIEISRKRDDMRSMIAPLNCADTFSTVENEREILRSYGGGCHQKIGASILRRAFGEVTFLRGLTDDGRVLDGCSLQASKPRPPRVASELLWPVDSSGSDWFMREKISAENSFLPNERGNKALWIAKAEALPDDWHVPAEQIVWASGVQTWKRLSRRGVWVNGCAESLGEQEPTRIETLVGGPLNWLKLTHEGGYADGEMPLTATYRLVSKREGVDLSGKRYFFWKSGSSFEHALRLNPWLGEMTHFCGPGNTQRILERNGVTPHVFLDHGQWLDEMCQNRERQRPDQEAPKEDIESDQVSTKVAP
jgi:hydroxymethylbilane synthase